MLLAREEFRSGKLGFGFFMAHRSAERDSIPGSARASRACFGALAETLLDVISRQRAAISGKGDREGALASTRGRVRSPRSQTKLQKNKKSVDTG